MYESKRLALLGTRTHLVELDLVRTGDPMPFRGTPQVGDYRILVARGDRRPAARLFPIRLSDSLPLLSIPLDPDEPEPTIDLNHVLAELYDRARYDLSIDYSSEPTPPLGEADRVWNDRLLREASLR